MDVYSKRGMHGICNAGVVVTFIAAICRAAKVSRKRPEIVVSVSP